MSNCLIVEDCLEWAETFSRFLKKTSKYTDIEVATNLEDALEYARETKFGLYFCDGDFPINGFERNAYAGTFFDFYEQLIKTVPNPNIILVSASLGNVKRARDMGIDSFDKSPFDYKGLIARIKR